MLVKRQWEHYNEQGLCLSLLLSAKNASKNKEGIPERNRTRVVEVVMQPDCLLTLRASFQRNMSEIAITEVRTADELSWWLK